MEDEMLRAKWLGVVYAVATLAVLAPGTVSAQPSDKRTFFTFSGNVDMPGVALPAGKYEFRIANPDSSRNVIQVRSGDGKKTFGLFLAHSAQRVTPSDEAEVRFLEAGAGAPPAIKTWWYPGERTGYEFVYPKQQARRLAQRARQPVLTTRSETATTRDTADSTELTRISPSGSESQVSENEAAEADPAGSRQAGQRADSGSVPPPAPAPAGTVARNRTQLPQTASATPLILLTGLLMLAAAAAMRQIRRRML
jgi:LPXTG-motif cell wall-anchored protein